MSSVASVLLETANAMRATSAQLVRLDHREVLAWMACLATLAREVTQERIMSLPQTAVTKEEVVPFRQAAKVLLDHLDHQALLDQKEAQALLARQEKEAELVPLDHLDQQAQLEATANQAPKAPLAQMEMAEKERKDPRDRPAQLDPQDPKAPMDHQLLEGQHPAPLDHLAHLDPQDQVPLLASKARKVHQAIPAQMLNIVLAHHEADWSIADALSLYSAISIKRAFDKQKSTSFVLFLFCLRRCLS